jgi:hypothetical protein
MYALNPFLGPTDPYGSILVDDTKQHEKICKQFQSVLAVSGLVDPPKSSGTDAEL